MTLLDETDQPKTHRIPLIITAVLLMLAGMFFLYQLTILLYPGVQLYVEDLLQHVM